MNKLYRMISFTGALVLIAWTTGVPAGAASTEEQKLYHEAQALLDSYTGNPAVLEKSADLIKQILTANPNSASGYVALGRLTYKSGYINYTNFGPEAVEKAKQFYVKAIKLDPSFVDAYFYGCYPYLNERKYDEAMKLAMKAWKLDPNSPKSALLFAEICNGRKKYDDADRWANAVIARTKDKKLLLDANNVLLDVANAQQRYDVANRYYLKIIALDPGSPWGLINYSNFLVAMSMYDQAIEYGKKALGIMDFGMGHHVLAKAYSGKGWNYLSNKDFGKGAEYFSLAVKHDPRNADAFYGLGMCYYQEGVRTKNVARLKDAERALSSAVEMNDKHIQARGALSELQRLINAAEKRNQSLFLSFTIACLTSPFGV